MPIRLKIADIPTHSLLADAKFNTPRKIDLLLVAEYFSIYLLKSGQIRCSSHNLLLEERIFRYADIVVVNNSSADSQYCSLLIQKEKIEHSLQNYRGMKNISVSNFLLSHEEQFFNFILKKLIFELPIIYCEHAHGGCEICSNI